jgi:hypothetical protein
MRTHNLKIISNHVDDGIFFINTNLLIYEGRLNVFDLNQEIKQFGWEIEHHISKNILELKPIK